MATIKGRWKWNSTIDNLLQGEGVASASINFVSNSESFSQLKIETYYAIPNHVEIYYDNKKVTTHSVIGSGNDYEVICEFDEKYRIMDFGETEQDIDDALYDFIAANATEYYTVADKARTIVKNMPEVYEAGKNKGRTEGYEAGYNKGYKEGLDTDAFEAGKQAEYDAFWDAFTQNGNRTNYSDAFLRWGSEYIRPNRTIIPKTVGGGCRTFHECPNLKKVEAAYFDFTHKPRGTQSSQGFYYMFYNNPALEEIEDIGMQADYSYEAAFADCPKLHTISKIRVAEDTNLRAIFSSCRKLKNVTFEGLIGQDIDFKSCTELTRPSIESIITHLSSKVSGKTLTLSSAAVNAAFPDDWDSYVTENKPAGWQIQLS